MKTKNLIGAAGLLLMSVAVFTVFHAAMRDDGAPPRPAGPELFPFVRPLDARPPGEPQPASPRTSPLVKRIDTGNAPDATAMAEVEAKVRQMRAQGATDDDVYRARAAAISAGTAATLARMEQEEVLWMRRVNAYFAERASLSHGRASTADAQADRQLRDARFTVEEQARLDAYETSAEPTLIAPQ